MPVKLITSDAKGFFTKFLAESANKEKIWNALISYNKKTLESARQINKDQLIIQKLLADIRWNVADIDPVIIKTPSGSFSEDWNGCKLANTKIRGKLFAFKNALFDVTGLHSIEEAKLLILNKYQIERREIDFLKSRADKSFSKEETRREHIPERIRNEVWRRDGGKCVECGSVYNLEFDHKIPVAKGGSHTARNLQILCEPCNRRKSDNIG
jgi:hypothetical protein